MGQITTENRRQLENAKNYADAVLTGMLEHEFSTALGQLIEEKGISVLSLVENTNISKSYINKLRNPSEKNVRPSRYVIIDLALALDASLEETNHLLKLAQYQELYTRNQAESVIIWGMLKNLSGREIRTLLYEKGFDTIFKEK